MFLADGELVAMCDSYYPAGLAQGTQIAQDRRIRGEVRAVIEDPDQPDAAPQEAAALLLPRAYRSSGCCGRFGTGDVLVEVQDTVAAAGRHEFRYEVSLNGDGGPGPR